PQEEDDAGNGFTGLVRNLLGASSKSRGDVNLRETIEGLIEEPADAEPSILEHERILLSNILRLRDLTAEDVMVPRADITAVEAETTLQDVLGVLSVRAHSRLPVYRESLDNVLGMLHIKDLIPRLADISKDEEARPLTDLVRELPVVAPSIPVLNLLLQMRESRQHMALVVDEFGGIDGLVTIEDLVEEIVGEIEDEHDVSAAPQMVAAPDGGHLIDARVPLEEFEAVYGAVLPEDEREDIDTVGGYVFTMAGRVPTRGEVLRDPDHQLEFLVTEADPRRVRRLRVIRSAPESPDGALDGTLDGAPGEAPAPSAKQSAQ
ncbi:MAG: hemolysin family protein, partial [Pseudomonadota bacterium]